MRLEKADLVFERRSRPDRDDAAVRICLGVLRAYLVAITLMLGYHVLDLAGAFHALK